MNQDSSVRMREKRHGEGVITAIAVGGTLIIIGLVFTLTPDLWQKMIAFFNDLSTAALPFSGSNPNIVLPAPANPAAHSAVYTALMQFDIGVGILQIIILALRLAVKSRVGKIAETVGNLVFWLGAAFLVNAFLLAGTLASWFEFWGALIVVVGVSLVARAVVYFTKR